VVQVKLSQRGVTFIKQWESCRLSAYLDNARVWTIGWGHTGPDVKMGTNWTQAQADSMFQKDVALYEEAVNRGVQVKLTQNQFDALVSLAYNIGVQAFTDSTLLKLLNEGSYNGAADQFPRWDKVHGKPLLGLQRRRFAEMTLFKEAPAWTPPVPPRKQSLVDFLRSIFSGFFTSR
jgi:lysozyme